MLTFRFCYFIPAFLHQPFWRTCCTAYSNRMDPVEPLHINFVGTFYLVAVGIHLPTLLKQHPTVAAFTAGNKQD